MTKQEERRHAAAPAVPLRVRRALRVAGGVGLGLFGHGVALAPGIVITVFLKDGGNNMGREYGAIIAFFAVEILLAVVAAISIIVRLVQRRGRDFAVGLMVGWLVPAAVFGIVVGIADLRQ